MPKFPPVILGVLAGTVVSQTYLAHYNAASFALILLAGALIYEGLRNRKAPRRLSERGRLIVAPFLAVLLGICLGMVVVMRSDSSVFQSILIVLAFVFLSLIICLLIIFNRLR